jgi:hypothetical protein
MAATKMVDRAKRPEANSTTFKFIATTLELNVPIFTTLAL